MLTGDLVRARVQKNMLSASFVKPTSEPLRAKADELVEVFQAGVEQEWTRAELDEAIHGVVADLTETDRGPWPRLTEEGPDGKQKVSPMSATRLR